MTKINLDKIKSDAEKATPGPWECNQDEVIKSKVDDCVISCGDISCDNAQHIANCDPQTILAMVEVVRAALADPIREGWEEGYCSNDDGIKLYEAQCQLEKALKPFTQEVEDE